MQMLLQQDTVSISAWLLMRPTQATLLSETMQVDEKTLGAWVGFIISEFIVNICQKCVIRDNTFIHVWIYYGFSLFFVNKQNPHLETLQKGLLLLLFLYILLPSLMRMQVLSMWS